MIEGTPGMPIAFVRTARAFCWLILSAFAGTAARAESKSYKFDFGPGKIEPGYTQVLPTTTYDPAIGYGFEPGAKIFGVHRNGPDALRGNFCTSDKPFFFSVKLPEGNYNVTVTLGDASGESTTTVKAESRRLMLERIHTAPGKFETRTFTVNVRTPRISDTQQVKLKKREIAYLHWDDKLTLEFSDKRPCVCAVEITPAPDAITLYLAGDSTVTDQPRDPNNSWGQMLPRFFKPGVAVANHAESGESLKSFTGARRIDKILSAIKPGDFLFIQFGHNDQKDRSRGAGAFTTYKDSLRNYIDQARARKAIPVLITPVSRRSFGQDGTIENNLGDFPDAVRQTAQEEKVTLIDLNEMSHRFYEAMGKQDSSRAFAPRDNTHHNDYGSYEIAKCVVEGIRKNLPDLAARLVQDVPPLDPLHPDPIDTFKLPPDPANQGPKPDGN
jgi:lysophospholipase L1-like esterase